MTASSVKTKKLILKVVTLFRAMKLQTWQQVHR